MHSSQTTYKVPSIHDQTHSSTHLQLLLVSSLPLYRLLISEAIFNPPLHPPAGVIFQRCHDDDDDDDIVDHPQ